jgi:hypothetical protein
MPEMQKVAVRRNSDFRGTANCKQARHLSRNRSGLIGPEIAYGVMRYPRIIPSRLAEA